MQPSATDPPPPAPRSVPFSAVGWNSSFLMLFGGIWLGVGTLVGLVLALTAGAPPWVDWAIDDHGKQAEAKPGTVRATGTRVNKQTVYEIELTYRDADGEKHQVTTRTRDKVRIEAARKGERLTVEYDPKAPEHVRFRGDSASIGLLFFLPFLFAGSGSVLFLIGLVGGARARAIYRNGKPAIARVTQVTLTASSQNRQRVRCCHYEFQVGSDTAALGYRDDPGDRRTFNGTFKAVRVPKEGSTMWILYDAAHPEKNTPVQPLQAIETPAAPPRNAPSQGMVSL